MVAIQFENVSKRYKLYSKGGLYLRDRITHALQRVNPFNGVQHSHVNSQPSSPSPLRLGSEHALERDFWALKDVSFEIKQGDSVGFIGRNGAGKSTILKLLAGVTKPTNGKVTVKGRVAALIEVGAGFHPELTGRENIYLNGSILGMRKTDIEKQFDSIVSFAELDDFIDTPVKHYSSGMYVRLGFAIAAHTDPDIFLIDEVLSVGDEAFQKKCLDTLEAHQADGKTMIFVSHALETVGEVCERGIYMDHGLLRCDDTSVHAIRAYRSDVHRKRMAKTSEEVGAETGAEIVDVICRNSEGKEVVGIETGDDLILEMRYRVRGKVNKPVFGFGFFTEKGAHITGFNTKTSSVCITSIQGEGSVFCRLPKLFLARGAYRISAAITDSSDKHTFAIEENRYRLDVSCEEIYTAGLVYCKGEWAEDISFSKPFIADQSNPKRNSSRRPM